MTRFLAYFLFVVFFFPNLSHANNVEFDTHIDLNKCIPFSEDIDTYSSSLQQCFNDKDHEFPDDFISSLRKNLPENFFTRVSFGEEAEQYMDKNYIAANPEITIEDYVNNFPNQIYAVDGILRGEKAIFK